MLTHLFPESIVSFRHVDPAGKIKLMSPSNFIPGC
jgi:hypothetical protein